MGCQDRWVAPFIPLPKSKWGVKIDGWHLLLVKITFGKNILRQGEVFLYSPGRPTVHEVLLALINVIPNGSLNCDGPEEQPALIGGYDLSCCKLCFCGQVSVPSGRSFCGKCAAIRLSEVPELGRGAGRVVRECGLSLSPAMGTRHHRRAATTRRAP
jgi:hypothetical protein